MSKDDHEIDPAEVRFLEGVRVRCPDNDRVLKALGDLYTRSGEFDKGLEVDERLASLCPDEADVWYNLGCSYALLNHTEEAFSALARAIELGYDNREWMCRDSDLQSIRKDPRFQNLIAQLSS